MATEEGLRSCCPAEEFLEWLHPGYHFDGRIVENQHWLDMPTWLGSDAGELREQLFRTRYKFFNFVGDVIELRLPEPFYIGEKRYRSRVFYAEPDTTQDLVSLGHLMKDTDSSTWRDE